MAKREIGLIYYMLDADRHSQRVKIGTTESLAARILDVRSQTFNRQGPLLLAVEIGGFTREKQLHAQYALQRLTGEWFKYEGQLRDYISTLDHPYAYISDRPELWCFAGGWCGMPVSTLPKVVLVEDEDEDEDDDRVVVEF